MGCSRRALPWRMLARESSRGVDPARAPCARAGGGVGGDRGAALAGGCRWGLSGGVRAALRGSAWGALRQRGVKRHGGASPRAARGRCRPRGTRSSPRPSPSSLRRTRFSTRGTAGLRRHRPGESHHRSGCCRRGDRTFAPGRSCRCTSSAIAMPAFDGCSSAMGLRSSRMPARRSARSHAEGVPVGGRGHPAVFGFYANKQMTTGEGGMVAVDDPSLKERIDSRAQPGQRAADMGWLDHDRLGFNYRLCDIACALGSRSWSGSMRCSPTGRALRLSTGRRSAGSRVSGCRAPVERGRARVVRVRRRSCRDGVDRDET